MWVTFISIFFAKYRLHMWYIIRLKLPHESKQTLKQKLNNRLCSYDYYIT